MNMLVFDNQPADMESVESGSVELVVLQPGASASRFALAEGKATIGSSPSCQIRLDSASVRPLQCLIVRRGEEVTVTRWAAGIQLNGVDFTTSPLRAGDVISIGDLRLQLASPAPLTTDLDPERQSPVSLIDEVEAKVAAEVADAEVSAVGSELQNSLGQADVDRLRSANRQTRQRFRRMVDALRRLRSEAHDLDQHVATLTAQLQVAQRDQEFLRAEFYQSQAIAAERESQIGEELDHAIAELTASYAKADEASHEIESLRARNEEVQKQLHELTAELGNLRELSQAQEADRLRFEDQLRNRESQLEQVREELATLRQQFERSTSELESQNGTLNQRLAEVQQERVREVAELRRGLEASVIELHDQNESLREQLAELCCDRNDQVAEFQRLNDSLRKDAQALVAERDQRISELEALHDSLQGQLTSAIEDRERQLHELYNQCETLRNDAATIAGDRDEQIAQLSAHFEARQTELSEVIAQRERELDELRDAMEQATRMLTTEVETLAAQLAGQAAERDRAIDDLAEAHRIAVEEYARQVDDLRKQMAGAELQRQAHVAALQNELEQTRSDLAELEHLRSQPDLEKVELESDLQAIRAERQKLAEENHHLALQLEDAEKRSKLLEIDVRSVNAEWQRTQSTVTRLQDELLTAQAHAADLDAKLCDFQCSAEIDRAVESDAFASDLASVRRELEQCEISLSVSRAESEQLRGELSAAEHELGSCRDSISDLNNQISALQTAATQLGAERSRLEALLEERTAQGDALRASAHRAEQEFAAKLAARDQQIAELDSKLSSLREEFVTAGEAGAARTAELTQKLTENAAVLATVEAERARLATATAEYEAQIEELKARATRIEESYVAELSDRDGRIAAISSELQSARQDLSDTASRHQTQQAEMASAFKQAEERLASEVEAKEALIAAHAAELAKLQDAIAADLTARDTKIVELLKDIENLNASGTLDPGAQQQALVELRQQLLDAQEKAAADLSSREDHITELSRELHETQDRLAECLAQGERVAELYQQAQADLTAAASQAAPVPPHKTNPTLKPSSESPPTAGPAGTHAPSSDPRDDEEPRLKRALACAAAEFESDESATKTVPFQQASFIDRYSHIFNDDGSEASGPETASAADEVPRLEDIDGDDSAALEAYMANMMKRVRGESSSDAIAPPLPRDGQSEQPSPYSNPLLRMNTLTERVGMGATSSLEAAEEEKLICLSELKQTSQKPPLPTSLSAMRELANNSARQAIAKHRKRRHFEGALSKLLVSGIAGGTATYLLLTADDYLSPYFLAGCGVAVVSAYWGVKLLGILLEMIRDGINNEGAPVELDESSDPLPIDIVSE